MPTTIKSVCKQVEKKLRSVPIQEFEAANAVSRVLLTLDPRGTKRLNPAQVETTKAFLDIVVATIWD